MSNTACAMVFGTLLGLLARPLVFPFLALVRDELLVPSAILAWQGVQVLARPILRLVKR